MLIQVEHTGEKTDACLWLTAKKDTKCVCGAASSLQPSFCYITRPPILSAVPLYWSTLCLCVSLYLLQSWRHAAVWQLWRNPKPTPRQSRRTPAPLERRSLLWKLHQLEGWGQRATHVNSAGTFSCLLCNLTLTFVPSNLIMLYSRNQQTSDHKNSRLMFAPVMARQSGTLY